jgi:hypothetical protein
MRWVLLILVPLVSLVTALPNGGPGGIEAGTQEGILSKTH